MSQLYSNSIFWIEVSKIKPNPYQPRKEFDEAKLQELADSVRQYGVLQPLVVSRVEIEKDDGLTVEYELIAGERRLRASKIAGLEQLPAIIRTGDDSKMKLEMAIIENLQREDLNPVDRARAFLRLADEFDFTHGQIGKKVGKSREYISNSLRLLSLPQEIMDGLSSGDITEGHTRPIMMLNDKPQEQLTLFKEIVHKKLTVREAESIARKIAHDKVRKKQLKPDPEMMEMEGRLSEHLGTRVSIEQKEVGGKIMIDFFSNDDLETILKLFEGTGKNASMLESFIRKQEEQKASSKSGFQEGPENVTEELQSSSHQEDSNGEGKGLGVNQEVLQQSDNQEDSGDIAEEVLQQPDNQENFHDVGEIKQNEEKSLETEGGFNFDDTENKEEVMKDFYSKQINEELNHSESNQEDDFSVDNQKEFESESSVGERSAFDSSLDSSDGLNNDHQESNSESFYNNEDENKTNQSEKNSEAFIEESPQFGQDDLAKEKSFEQKNYSPEERVEKTTSQDDQNDSEIKDKPFDDRSREEVKDSENSDDEDLYFIKNFNL